MFAYQDRVQWNEGVGGKYICTGTIISQEKDRLGKNPHGFWCIKVDDEHYLRACRTAQEMHLRWVTRSILFNKLCKLETV